MRGGIVVALAFAALTWLERRRPLRRRVEPSGVRLGRNLAVAVLSGLAVQLAERPLLLPLAARVERAGWGILGLVPLPAPLATVVALALMDYTLYLWHVLTHRVPWLWRFHLVHHVDRDLDASTAVRFHAAELLVSVPWRAGQLVLIGVGPGTFTLWQGALLVSTMFHHSNLRLPARVETWVARVIVTPRMHGIHHSIVRAETDSNWSSGLVLWDRLHGTLRVDVPPGAVTIGVPAYRAPADVTLGAILTLPFRRQRPSWVPVTGAPPAATLQEGGTPAPTTGEPRRA